MASGILDTSLPTLSDYLKHNHFDNISIDSPKLTKLVEAHGVDAVCSAICQVSKKLKPTLKPLDHIHDGIRLIKDYLQHGPLFEGLPVVHSLSLSESTGQQIPLLRWELAEKANQFLPLSDSGFYCKNVEILNAIEQAPERAQFTSVEEVQEIFSHLKKLIPHKYVSDGCVLRCFFVDAYVKHLLKLPCTNRRFSTDSGKELSLGPLYPEELHHRWMGHLVASVPVGGCTYILDMVLKAPLPEDQWISGLHDDEKDLYITPVDKWSEFTVYTEEASSSQFLMSYFQTILRAMYLFEKVDNNVAKHHRSLRTWRKFTSS